MHISIKGYCHGYYHVFLKQTRLEYILVLKAALVFELKFALESNVCHGMALSNYMVPITAIASSEFEFEMKQLPSFLI